jgi:hypothetical protein
MVIKGQLETQFNQLRDAGGILILQNDVTKQTKEVMPQNAVQSGTSATTR